MEGLPPCNLPGNVFLVRLSAGDAEEPCAQLPATRSRSVGNRLKRYLHFPLPYLTRGVDPGIHLKSGVPGSPATPIPSAAIDVEVHPLALRRDLELLVATNIREVGAQESL